ncbi:S1C family serine protease [Streptomyces sp. NPDC048172]|uniref:S1C family serine protease n=1 Tax=Streptomyces sp. NPDC048172 TaxID=3365505 RepID=UPI003710A3EE
MDEGKAARPRPQWWSRPRGGPAPEAAPAPAESSTEPSTEPRDEPRDEVPETAQGPASGRTGTGRVPEPGTVPSGPPKPLHGEDPYATPPYGGPGPWAPAPPVQLPSATPPHGVQAYSPATTPPYGVPTVPRQTPHPEPGPPPVPAGPAHGPAPGPVAPVPAPVPAAAPAPVPVTATVPAPVPVPPGRRRGRGGVVVGALALALVAGGTGGLIGAYVERNGNVSDVELPQAPEERRGGKNDRAPGTIAGIARQALPGVVTLHARGGGQGKQDGEQGQEQEQGTGTGFVLDRRGHILTNEHVVGSARSGDSVQVKFHGGQTARGEVVGKDSGYDLAVVKVSGISGLKPLPLGNSGSVRVGDPVVAIGSPFDLDGTVTTGIISATRRPITAGGEESGSETSYVDALQTDAPINPGNSGGPLVDTKGRVVGITSALKPADGGSRLPGNTSGGSIGLGFAIPVNQARRVAEELINDGRATHPVIGITVDMEYEGDGARIGAQDSGEKAVTPDGPADKAGLKEGDVVTAADGTAVHGGEELIVRIRSHRPGDKLALTVRRDGDTREVKVTLGSGSGGE